MTQPIKIRENLKLGLTIASGAPISAKLLNDMMHNDELLDEIQLESMVRNVKAQVGANGRNQPRKFLHKNFLDREIAVWGDVEHYNFGSSTTIGAGDSRPSWTGFQYLFPSITEGDFFHNDYLPVVVCQILNTPNLVFPELVLVITRIKTNFFNFEIHQLEDGDFINASDDLWVSILAIGRKGNFYPRVDTELQAPSNYVHIPSHN